MVSYSRSLVVLSVAAALAVPATLAAQTAIPRTGGSSSSGSSGGSSGSGGSTTSSGGGSSSESSRVSLPSMPSFPTDSRRPSGSSSSSREGTSRGGSVDRGDGPVGPGTSRGSAVERGSSMVPTSGSAFSTLGSRSRGDRPVTGSAIDRPAGSLNPNYNLYFPIDPFSPWGRWYPWYYGGFGYGYLSFDPWRYGTSRYSMYRYGAWYNPYDPWCYGVGYWLCDPWGGAATSSYGGSGGGRSTRDESEEEPTASIRLRVSPATAKVYVDGALVGTVSDFSGLTGHLKVTLGQHLVEIKADGYETFVPKIELVAGRTTTVRGVLKKQ